LAKIFTIGEALIDFIPAEKGVALKEVTGFVKEAGGAPANVACAVARLGGESAFIGKLGADAFGDFLLSTLQEVGVDTRYVFRTTEANTALAFVSLKADGNRDFMFYRKPSADMLLAEEDIKQSWFHAGDILHFCSVDLIEAPVKYAHIRAIQAMKAQGGIVSFDPNVRLPLWEDKEQCRQTILQFIPYTHILKISDEELEFITGIKDEKSAIASLFVGDVKLVIYTKGPDGAELHTQRYSISVPALKVQVLETTGAGDAFIGAFLYQISRQTLPLSEISKEAATQILEFAATVAGITTTKKGAIQSLPTLEEVKNFKR
jgi:fructokinase